MGDRAEQISLGLPLDTYSYAILPISYSLGRFGPVRHIGIADVVFEGMRGQAYRDL